MKIHKEGRNIIFITTLVTAICCGLISLYVPLYLLSVFIILSLVIILAVAMFFRNPERIVEQYNNMINCPADGKILDISNTSENEYFKEEKLKISIFMSVTSVHLNRVPVKGKVIYTKYHPGKYMVAFHPKSSELNERNTVVIKADNGEEVLVRQIAGAVARRIRPYLKLNDKVDIGDELGFIRFGSRLDIYLPSNIKLNAEVGQKVYGNKTILAYFV